MSGNYHPSMNTDTLRKIADVIEQNSNMSLGDIYASGRLYEDFDMDSMDRVTASAELENVFNLAFEDEFDDNKFYKGEGTPEQIAAYIEMSKDPSSKPDYSDDFPDSSLF